MMQQQPCNRYKLRRKGRRLYVHQVHFLRQEFRLTDRFLKEADLLFKVVELLSIQYVVLINIIHFEEPPVGFRTR